jgi:hypothetical protein
MNPTVGQPLDKNPHHWRRPAFRESSGAEWVGEHRFAGEDWNFDVTQEYEGYLYGYGQGEVGVARRSKTTLFDVLFYVYCRPDGVFRAAGLYIDAEYLTGHARIDAWNQLETAGIIARREADLRHAFGTHPKIDEEIRLFRHEKPIRWKVRTTNVVVFDDLPKINPLRPTDYRHKNAYDWSSHPWTTAGAGAPSSPSENLLLRVRQADDRRTI